MPDLRMTTSETEIDSGSLQVNLISSKDSTPIPGATIKIYYTGAPDRVISTLITDSSGQALADSLSAPDLSYSLNPSLQQPYSEYNLYRLMVSNPF